MSNQSQSEFGSVEKSIKDLTRIETTLTADQAPVFVAKFMKKYNIPSGSEKAILRLCLAEIGIIEAEKV